MAAAYLSHIFQPYTQEQAYMSVCVSTDSSNYYIIQPTNLMPVSTLSDQLTLSFLSHSSLL